METFLYSFVIVLFITILLFILKSTPQQTEEELNIRKSLEDEFIYDPETGAKITLEQAESGNWLLPDEEIKKKNEHEYIQSLSEGELNGHRVIERIEKEGFVFKKLSETKTEILENLRMLQKYDDWTYINPYYNKDSETIIFFPTVELSGRGESHYRESQLMLWKKINNYGGHYYFREKTTSEKLLDRIKNDDTIKLDNYESFIIRKGNNILPIIRFIESIDNERGLEIEIVEGNLFIKTLKLPNLNDYERLVSLSGSFN